MKWIMKKFKSLITTVKLTLSLLGTVFEHSKSSGVLLFTAVLCNVFLALGGLFLTKEVTYLIVNGSDFTEYVITILLVFSVISVSYVSREIIFKNLEIRFHEIGVNLEGSIHKKTFGLDYEDTQNSNIIDEKFKAIHSVNPESYSSMVKQLGFLLSDFITMVVIVIVSINSSMLLLGLLMIMTFIKSVILIVQARLDVKVWDKLNVNNRRFSYLVFKIFEPNTVEDIKIYKKEETLRNHIAEYRGKSKADVKE